MMKKIKGNTVCNILCILLIACFFVKTAVDYIRYTSTLNSAPFYLWIIANGVYFIVPAIVVLIAGIMIKKKAK